MAFTSKTLTGARVKLYINNVPVGTFSSVAYDITQGAQDIFVLGSANAKEIVLTEQDTVTVTVGGFRNIGTSPFGALGMSQVKDLINKESTTLKIVDRLASDGTKNNGNNEPDVFELQDCKVIRTSMSYSARGVASMELTIRGIRFKDEQTAGLQDDDGSVSYP